MKNTWLNLFLILVCLSACSTKQENNLATNAQNGTVENTTQTNEVSSSYFYINTLRNEKPANITIDEEKIQLSLQNTALFGKLKGDKRKYYNASNEMQFAVKLSENGFKLRDAQEELLWKVKLYDDKIKLANNEEMENAYEIKLRDDKLKIEQNNEEIEVFRFNPQAPNVQLNEAYMVRGFGNSIAMGVLLIGVIPEPEKFMLCTEILKRGK